VFFNHAASCFEAWFNLNFLIWCGTISKPMSFPSAGAIFANDVGYVCEICHRYFQLFRRWISFGMVDPGH